MGIKVGTIIKRAIPIKTKNMIRIINIVFALQSLLTNNKTPKSTLLLISEIRANDIQISLYHFPAQYPPLPSAMERQEIILPASTAQTIANMQITRNWETASPCARKFIMLKTSAGTHNTQSAVLSINKTIPSVISDNRDSSNRSWFIAELQLL